MTIHKIQAFLLDPSVEWATTIKQSLHDLQIDMTYWNGTGSGWLEPLTKDLPHIIFVDFLLSKRDAFECLRMLGNLPQSPYIIFTHAFYGLPANALEFKALQLGAHAVLQKPASAKKIKLVLERALQLNRV